MSSPVLLPPGRGILPGTGRKMLSCLFSHSPSHRQGAGRQKQHAQGRHAGSASLEEKERCQEGSQPVVIFASRL